MGLFSEEETTRKSRVSSESRLGNRTESKDFASEHGDRKYNSFTGNGLKNLQQSFCMEFTEQVFPRFSG